MTTVSGTSGGAEPRPASGTDARASTAFKAEVVKAETPQQPPQAQASAGQGSGNLVAPKEPPTTQAKSEVKAEAAEEPPKSESAKSESAKAESKTETKAGASKAEGSRERPKAEPSHLSTVNNHSGQLGSMQTAIADAESLRGSQGLGAQGFNNAMSFVNGERRNWEQANASVSDYERKLDAFAAGAKDAPSADELKAARRDAERAVQAYTGQSIANDVGAAEAAASGAVRAEGLGRAAGGALETAAGVGMALTPEPTGVTKAAAAVAIPHGLDNLQSGLRQAFTGERTNTLTHEGAAAAARTAGLDEGTADAIGAGVDTAAGIGVPAGLIQRAGRNMDEGMRLVPAAVKAGKDAIGEGFGAARDFGRDLLRSGEAPTPGPAGAPSSTGAPDPAGAPDLAGSPAPAAPSAAPEARPLNPDNLFAGAEPLDPERYPGLSQMRLPNGAAATVADEFQRTRLDKHFLNDVQDVVRAADGAGQGRPVTVPTRSGKTVEGEFLGSGAETRAYRFGDDLVVKVKTPTGDIYEPPSERLLAMHDLKNAPEAAFWARDHNLHMGDALLSVQGPGDGVFNADLMVQPFYPSNYLQSLESVPGLQGVKGQMDDVLRRTGHPTLDADSYGANLAVRRDRTTMETSRTFFDPVIGEGDVSNNAPSAWRRYDVDPAWARETMAERAALGRPMPPIPRPPGPGNP